MARNLNWQQELVALLHCPLSGAPIKEPITLSCGHSVDAQALQQALNIRVQNTGWFRKFTGQAAPSCHSCQKLLPQKLPPIDKTLSALLALCANSAIADEQLPRVLQLLTDPSTKRIMYRPVILRCGHSFEAESIKDLNHCPICQTQLGEEKKDLFDILLPTFKKDVLVPNIFLQKIINLVVERNNLYAQQFFTPNYFFSLLAKNPQAEELPTLIKVLFHQPQLLHSKYETHTVLHRLTEHVSRDFPLLAKHGAIVTHALTVEALHEVSQYNESIFALFTARLDLVAEIYKKPSNSYNWHAIIAVILKGAPNVVASQALQPFIANMGRDKLPTLAQLLFHLLVKTHQLSPLLIDYAQLASQLSMSDAQKLLTIIIEGYEVDNVRAPLIFWLTTTERGINFLLALFDRYTSQIVNKATFKTIYKDNQSAFTNLATDYKGCYLLAVHSELGQVLEQVDEVLAPLTATSSGIKFMRNNSHLIVNCSALVWQQELNNSTPILNLLNQVAGHNLLLEHPKLWPLIAPTINQMVTKEIVSKLLLSVSGRKLLTNAQLLATITSEVFAYQDASDIVFAQLVSDALALNFLIEQQLASLVTAPVLNTTTTSHGEKVFTLLISSALGLKFLTKSPKLLTLLTRDTLVAVSPQNKLSSLQILLQTPSGQYLLQQHFDLLAPIIGDYSELDLPVEELGALILLVEAPPEVKLNQKLKYQCIELKEALSKTQDQLHILEARPILPSSNVNYSSLKRTNFKANS